MAPCWEDVPMSGTRSWCVAMLVFAIGLPGVALAEPECEGARHSRRDCPRSEYSPLHYWAPTLYQVRACIRPSNLDEFPPGPSSPVPALIDVTKYRCRSIPPTPSSPYADPASYYG